ncbi:MAG: hypothetical protein KGI38_10875 [Thaumarchaeota archaeon]|nr:hypothetical protein [Nitrososphaerota archaeon]
MLAGVAGLALTIPDILPPLVQSVVLGSSIGLIVVGPVGQLAMAATTPKKKSPPEVQLKELVEQRTKTRKLEHEKILDNFDEMLSKVEELDDPEVNQKVTLNFDRFVERLTSHYPQWDAEGRLRTYVLMQKIADSLTLRNADTYLNMAYRTLVARGSEATEISHITLNGKVERIYREPESEWARHLAGTLILMNKEDEGYAKGLVEDAIQLWSDERFERLLPDFKAIRLMSESARMEVEDMIEKEMAKARRVGNAPAILRSRKILDTIIRSHGESPLVSNR